MTYYCEFPNDQNIIRTQKGDRIVGRYLIVNAVFLQGNIAHNAVRIIRRCSASKLLMWNKHDTKMVRARLGDSILATANALIPEQSLLTKDEQKELVFQILKSETW
jgi:hypothetical protein